MLAALSVMWHAKNSGTGQHLPKFVYELLCFITEYIMLYYSVYALLVLLQAHQNLRLNHIYINSKDLVYCSRLDFLDICEYI